MKTYSLRKSTKVLRHIAHLLRRKKNKFTELQRKEIQATLSSLQEEILKGDREKASVLAKQAESLVAIFLKKTFFDHVQDLFFALAFALLVAFAVRTMWFELYEIPSGSMRPTFKEQDRLIVSKTDFGINLPFTTKHIYFDPSLVQRMGIVIFTGANMDMRDPDTVYFYLFPGKKQYIKRLIGKPGDTLYFYGGQIWGIDKDGKDISSEFQQERFSNIDHIPFIRFDGNVALPSAPNGGIYTPVEIYQMNELVAKLSLTNRSHVSGDLIGLPSCRSCEYYDLWGFKNYAMARLLNKEQLDSFMQEKTKYYEEGVLYLELKHHPSFANARLSDDEMGRIRPILGVNVSIVPLQENHLRTIFANMYTARFVVKNGFAMRLGLENRQVNTHWLPRLPDVPDGTYEFYEGKAYEIQFQGLAKELPSDHPLYRFDAERVQLFFNVGIEFDQRFAPNKKYQRINPARYSYFRNQELYVLGAPLLKKNDPSLLNFIDREQKRGLASNPQNPYLPFVDLGPPLTKEGTLDIEAVKKYGLKIPSDMYLALGDNHAMSSDSRDFGFVPEGNLRGGPDFIFWPPGPRWGHPNQPPYPWINLPRSIIWTIVAITLGTWSVVHYRRNKLPMKFE